MKHLFCRKRCSTHDDTSKRALLIGNAVYDYKLENFPQIKENVRGIKNLLENDEDANWSINQYHNLNLPELQNKLASFLRKTKRDDTVFVYYAGHGANESDTERKLYLAAADSKEFDDEGNRDVLGSWLSSSNVADMLKTCRAKKVVFVMDCCFAGGMDTEELDRRYNPDEFRGPPPLDDVRKRSQLTIMMATNKRTRAWVDIENCQYTAYTRYFIATVANGLENGKAWLTPHDIHVEIIRHFESARTKKPDVHCDGKLLDEGEKQALELQNPEYWKAGEHELDLFRNRAVSQNNVSSALVNMRSPEQLGTWIYRFMVGLSIFQIGLFAVLAVILLRYLIPDAAALVGAVIVAIIFFFIWNKYIKDATPILKKRYIPPKKWLTMTIIVFFVLMVDVGAIFATHKMNTHLYCKENYRTPENDEGIAVIVGEGVGKGDTAFVADTVTEYSNDSVGYDIDRREWERCSSIFYAVIKPSIITRSPGNEVQFNIRFIEPHDQSTISYIPEEGNVVHCNIFLVLTIEALQQLGRNTTVEPDQTQISVAPPENCREFVKFKEATDLLKNRNYKRAMPMFEELVEEYPGFAPAWHNLGLVYQNLGMNKDAVNAHQNAIMFLSEPRLIFFMEGIRACHKLRDLQCAITVYDAATDQGLIPSDMVWMDMMLAVSYREDGIAKNVDSPEREESFSSAHTYTDRAKRIAPACGQIDEEVNLCTEAELRLRLDIIRLESSIFFYDGEWALTYGLLEKVVGLYSEEYHGEIRLYLGVSSANLWLSNFTAYRDDACRYIQEYAEIDDQSIFASRHQSIFDEIYPQLNCDDTE